MAGKLVHFELPASDAARAKEFYSGLFGWKFNAWEGPVEYHTIDSSDMPGGAVYPSEKAGSGPTIYFDVDDINAGAARVRELGGQAEEPGPIPGIGWYAQCADTEGNPFGLFQPDDDAPAPGQA